MNRIQRDTMLGCVFFGALMLLLWATVNLTDVSLQRVPAMVVSFPDAGGIRIGDPVLLLGKRVGKVNDVQFVATEPLNRMRLDLRLEQPVDLTDKYLIEIQDSGVLGGKQVYIDPGLGPVAKHDKLTGTTRGNAFERVADPFSGKGPVGEELLGTLQEARSFFRNLNDEDTSIGALVRRRELYDEVLGSVQSLRRIVQAVEAGDGILGRLAMDTTLRDDAMTFVANLRRLSDELTGTDGTIGKLINDRELGTKLETAVADLQAMIADARAGKGALGRVLSDQQLADNLSSAVGDLALALRRANDPEAGTIGRLLADPQTGEDTKVAVANIRFVTEQLKSGKGTLGLLINDKEMGVRLRRIFTQVSRALEDAREAAPIATFVQVLIGAF